MTDVSEFKIEKYDGTEYVYPAWAQWTGRILSACTIACIPIGAVIAVVRARVDSYTPSVLESCLTFLHSILNINLVCSYLSLPFKH